MPDRIIRDELLRSHRFVALSSDTVRMVFIAFVLCADDLGNAEATPTAIGIMLVRSVSEDTAAKWLSELADVDLVRVYESDGKRYVHLPRFRQRLRYSNGKHPRPPSNIECKEIRELAQKVRPRSGSSQTTVSPESAEVKRSEVKRSEPLTSTASTLPAGFIAFWAAYPAEHRRVAKASCAKLWIKLGLEQIAETIVGHVKTMAATDQWRQGYEPAPLTYLRGRRWEDELPRTKHERALAL